MDSLGNYVGGGKMYLPPSVIKKMKKNMKKVPIIHEKSENYHLKEEQEAENILEAQLGNNEQNTIN